MNQLAIDTSTQTMGIALMKEDQIVVEYTSEGNNDHSKRLMPAIYDAIKQAKLTPESLDSIVVTKGPGSYTGTRIGITTAKAMAWALSIPMKTVFSLKLMAYNGVHFKGYVCPFIDARRGMVYTALYQGDQGVLETVKKEINTDFSSWLSSIEDMEESILFLSGDMGSFKEDIAASNANAIIPSTSVQRIHPSHLFTLAEDEAPSEVHGATPNYLRKTEAETKWLEQQRLGDKGEHNDG